MGVWKSQEWHGSAGRYSVSDSESGRTYQALSEDDATWLTDALNEANSSVVKLFCRTVGCRGVNSFITRGAVDARKNVYTCEDCNRPMVK